MKKFVVSCIQNKITTDKTVNHSRIKELINSAIKLHKPQLVVLSEFWNCPMGSSKNYAQEFSEDESNSPSLKILSSLAKEHNIYMVGGSIPIKDSNNKDKIFNTCYCFDNKGNITTKYRKMHLFDVDIPGKITYKESEKITPGDKNDLLTVFKTPFANIGIGICYDLRFYEHSHLLKKLKNIDVMCYPAAFSLPTGEMHWDLLRRMRALDNNVHVIMCSPSRNWEEPDTHQVYGYSSVIDPYGKVVSSLGYDEGILSCTVDLDINSKISEQIPTWKHKRSELYDVIAKF